jgi:hypothetical protein|eukprot:COSAG01_NODE_1856_length_9043_cov_87.168679_6_plen_47_part_00
MISAHLSQVQQQLRDITMTVMPATGERPPPPFPPLEKHLLGHGRSN